MTLAEQIKALQKKMADAQEKRDAIVVKSATEGVALTDEQITEINGINDALAADEKQLGFLVATEKSMAARAVAVNKGLEVPAGAAITVERNAPKGSAFTRTAMVLAKAKGNLAVAQSLAEVHYKDDPLVTGIVKAAVAAGSTQVSAWAGNLVYPQEYAGDFVELLYPETVVGRLNLRKVPFNVTIAGQTSGATVGWVGEGKAKPVTSAGFNRVFLEWCKVGALSVMSDELIRFSNPAAEALVQADLIRATAQGIDTTFLGTSAAVANISPAGLLNGVTAVPATGADYESVRKDVRSLLAPFIAANYPMQSAVLVMSPARALAIGSMLTPLGVLAFPNLGMDGGTLMGIKVITSNNVAGDVIDLFIQSEIFLSEDAGPQIDISTEASIVMDSAPDSASSTPISMFQNSMVAIRVGQFINWQKRRTLASGQISGVTYGD
jgi:HK97 family phage major capsid protein